MKKTTGENNPSLLAIKAEGEKIRPSILENIHNLRTNLQTSLQKINSSKSTYNSELSTIPLKEKELLDYNRQQAIKNSVYTFLLQKREETALARSSTVADNQMIDSAESSMIPNSPNRSVIYAMAIMLGLLVGVCLITIREVLGPKVLFRTEIENFTAIPIVAELAKIKEKRTLVINCSKHLFISEQFRQLRTMIGLCGKIKTKRKILITSNIAGEGKSFVSTNLALSLAMSGKKVVLVDLDLRKARTSEIFNMAMSKGVIEFLEGTCEPYEIIKQTNYVKLFIVPTGVGSSNLAEILLDEKIDALFKFLEQAFDIIIIDTSPINPASDPFVLAEYCDTTLFVVRHAYTPKTMVQLMDTNNKIKAFNNLAIVFNGIKPRGFIRKGFGFGFGYGYENIYKNYAYKGRTEEADVVFKN
jgi:capsular exopolysaccharide synthesis family protein